MKEPEKTIENAFVFLQQEQDRMIQEVADKKRKDEESKTNYRSAFIENHKKVIEPFIEKISKELIKYNNTKFNVIAPPNTKETSLQSEYKFKLYEFEFTIKTKENLTKDGIILIFNSKETSLKFSEILPDKLNTLFYDEFKVFVSKQVVLLKKMNEAF